MLRSQSITGTNEVGDTTQNFGMASGFIDQQLNVESEGAVGGNFRLEISLPEEIIREEKGGWESSSNDPNFLMDTNIIGISGGISYGLDELMETNGADLEFRSIGSENSSGPPPIRRSESSMEDALQFGALDSNDFHFSSPKDRSTGSPMNFFQS
jgi:hypothetical protein